MAKKEPDNRGPKDQGIQRRPETFFNPTQLGELQELQVTVLESKGWKPDSDKQQQAARIAGSIIHTGITQRTKATHQTEEALLDTHPSMHDLFAEGLEHRRKVVESLRNTSDTGRLLHTVTPDESHVITALDPTDVAFDETTAMLTREITQRRQAAEKLHQLLFYADSPLAQEAAEMRKTIDTTLPETMLSGLSPADTAFAVDNLLYANLLLRIGIYDSAEHLGITPADVAELHELWKDPATRERNRERIAGRMSSSVQAVVGTPEEKAAMMTYTSGVLSSMEDFVHREITIQDMKFWSVFALTEKDLTEETEKRNPYDVKRFEEKEIAQKDIDKARTIRERWEKLEKQFTAISSPSRRTKSEQQVDDEGTAFIEKKYKPFFGKLTPAELYMAYGTLPLDTGQKDVEEFTPLSTHLELLQMLQARSFRVRQTGEPIPEFTDPVIRPSVSGHLEKVIIERLLSDNFGQEGISYQDALMQLPPETFGRYLRQLTDPDYLSPEQRKALLYDIPDSMWYVVALQNGTYAPETGDIARFTPESAFLEPFFEAMPPERKAAVTTMIKGIVDLE